MSTVPQRESIATLDERPGPLAKLSRALAARDVAEGRDEVRIVRQLQIAMAIGSMPMIAGLAGLYAAGGHTGEALWCGAYVAATLVLLLALVATGTFAVLRVPHTLVVAALPLGLTIYMGGIAQAGGATLWTLIVPIAATMINLRGRRFYFLGVALALVLVYFVRRDVPPPLTGRELEFHFVFNTVGFTGFLFMSVRYFVSRIDAEKARAEGLLRRVLPAPIVRRLKRAPGVIADHHEHVTVVFADIVGFTPLAARLSPTELVELLDAIFSKFDELAKQFGVEKIKTIGDAYMAVAGAPEHCTDHAVRAARLALAMRDVLAEVASERSVELSMRIGMHSGEAVAGVIGIERFAYDLWGDTVNTASRMESHGQPGSIQLTQATRDALGDAFKIRERGPIEVKGRGTIVTYWLDA